MGEEVIYKDEHKNGYTILNLQSIMRNKENIKVVRTMRRFCNSLKRYMFERESIIT